MGTVYRAVNTETQETLAVKVLAPVYSTDEHFRNRFESEIKALLKLDHPNIVRLVSYGQHESNLYFAMELVEGQSLFQIQRDGKPFHWREVIRIAKNIALGLRHAHDRGIIHRDLKPGNLLRANTGIVKITDFGIAKSFGQNQNTGTNVLGTIDFMSPEQAKGQPVTFRSDLYSLGTVMYTLLAGQPPFSANSVEESMRNLTKVPAPRIIRQAPDVPQKLDSLIAQLLEKDPQKRVATALSLYHQLRKVEQILLDSSRAVTAERPLSQPSSSTSVVTDSTSIDEIKGAAQTIQNESRVVTESRVDSDAITQNDDLANSRVDHVGPSLRRGEKDADDFFNRVTDDERQEHLELEAEVDTEESSSSGKIVLSACLLVVIALAGFGIYRSNQVPSSEVLLAKIDEFREQPQKRISEIRAFLSYYPEHKDFEMIEVRLRKAEAFQKIHRLRAKRKANQELSDIERDLLEIVDLANQDAPKSHGRIKALITLYENESSLNEGERQSLNAAKAYEETIKADADQQTASVRKRIETQLARAETLSDVESKVIYQSIIELNRQFEWVYDLIEIAETRLDEINSKNIDTPTTDSNS